MNSLYVYDEYECDQIWNLTVYAVHLKDIKFGKLIYDVSWRIFNLATRVIQNV